MSEKNIKHIGKLFFAISTIVIVILLEAIYSLKSPLVVGQINNDKCYGVHKGDRILYINNVKIHSINDFENALKKISKGEEVDLVVNNMPAKCYAISNGDIGIKLSKERKFPLLGSDIKPVVYILSSNEQEINTIEKRLRLEGLDDYQIRKLSNDEYEIKIPTFFKDIFEEKILKPYKAEFFLAKYLNSNETFNVTNYKIEKINSTTNKLEVKLFDSSDISDAVVKKTCLSQAAERCEITISLKLNTPAFEKFKDTIKQFGFKIILLRKFVNGNLEIKVDNKTVLTTLLPYEISTLNTPSLIITLPVNETYVDEAEETLKYSLETKPLYQTKIVSTKNGTISFSNKDIVSIIILAISISSVLVMKKYVSMDAKMILTLSTIATLLTISKLSAIVFSFIVFALYVKYSDNTNLVKIYVSTIILTIAAFLFGVLGTLSILVVSAALSTLYITILLSSKISKTLLYTFTLALIFLLSYSGFISLSFAISIGLLVLIFRELL